MSAHRARGRGREQDGADPSRLPVSLRLDEVLAWRARHAGREPAIILARAPHDGRCVTWREWHESADRAASGFEARGLQRGSLVGIVLEDSPACLAAIFGAWRLGAVVVPIDARWGRATADGILSHAHPACVAGPDAGAVPGAWVTAHPGSFHGFDELEPSGPVPQRAPAGSADDLAMIAYTSGTTSNPKGVVLRHRHLRHAYRIAREALFEAPPARVGHVLRMAGLGAFGASYAMPLECGSPVVVMPELGIETAKHFWREVARHAVDFLYLVPTLVQLLTRLSDPVDDPRRVLCITGGAPIARDVHACFQDRFGHPLRNVYGLTEASFGFLWGAYEPGGRGAWHLGRPPKGVRIRLRDARGRCSAAVSEGLLEVRGPMISDGYWTNEAATREVVVRGWLRTADLARRDPDGNYTITGRMKDIVVRGGSNIHLDEVDETLSAHPQVLDACTVGITARTGHEELAAMVQLAHGGEVSSSDLAAWCRARLGPAKTPGVIVLTEQALPRNSSGKVPRAAIARLLADTGHESAPHA